MISKYHKPLFYSQYMQCHRPQEDKTILTLSLLHVIAMCMSRRYGWQKTFRDESWSKDNTSPVGSHMWRFSITQAGLLLTVANNCHSGFKLWPNGATGSSEQEHPGENKDFQHELWLDGQGVKSAAGELLVWVHAGKICVGKVGVTCCDLSHLLMGQMNVDKWKKKSSICYCSALQTAFEGK